MRTILPGFPRDRLFEGRSYGAWIHGRPIIASDRPPLRGCTGISRDRIENAAFDDRPISTPGLVRKGSPHEGRANAIGGLRKNGQSPGSARSDPAPRRESVEAIAHRKCRGTAENSGLALAGRMLIVRWGGPSARAAPMGLGAHSGALATNGPVLRTLIQRRGSDRSGSIGSGSGRVRAMPIFNLPNTYAYSSTMVGVMEMTSSFFAV